MIDPALRSVPAGEVDVTAPVVLDAHAHRVGGRDGAPVVAGDSAGSATGTHDPIVDSARAELVSRSLDPLLAR